MLEISNVTINLKSDERCIIDDFSFTLKPGDKAVIIGEEGNGKSTLLKFIYNQNSVKDYCNYSGKVITNCKLAYLPQTLDEKYYDVTLQEFFDSTDYYMHMDILASLGLTLDFILSSQKLKTLSGGEKIKVQLLKLILESPDILLLDEPTNDLDIKTLLWLEDFISNSKLSILFISHDETLIENTANVILHMEQLRRKTKCRISVANCTYSDYISYRNIDFAHKDQVAQTQRDNYKKQMGKWQKIYNKVDYEQKVISRSNPAGAAALKKKMHSLLSMEKRFNREQESFTEYSEAEDSILTKFKEDISMPNGKKVLDFHIDKLIIDDKLLSENVNLVVKGNEHIGIIGNNGCGKSTLLKLIWDDIKDRTDIIPAYMPQDYHDVLNYEQTLIEHFGDNFKIAQTYMASMKFNHKEMTGKIKNLSGGQKAKILFLDMVLSNSNFLLLDEPTRNFSPLSNPVIRKALNNFGGTIISISHDRKYLDEVCDKIYSFEEKGLVII